MALKRVFRVGVVDGFSYYVTVKYDEDTGRISFTGDHGPSGSGNAISCGQCIDPLRNTDMVYAKGWTRALAEELADLWDAWHLNDMVPGSPAQMKWLKQHGHTGKPYEEVSRLLSDAGLNPDPDPVEKGYKYGSAWRTKHVPKKVVDLLFRTQHFPDADRTHPWHVKQSEYELGPDDPNQYGRDTGELPELGELLNRLRVKMSSTLVERTETGGFVFMCTLRQDFQRNRATDSLKVTYRMGAGHAGPRGNAPKPTKAAVVGALFLDFSCFENSDGIDDFKANYCPNAGVVETLEMYEACSKAGRDLKAFFGSDFKDVAEAAGNG